MAFVLGCFTGLSVFAQDAAPAQPSQQRVQQSVTPHSEKKDRSVDIGKRITVIGTALNHHMGAVVSVDGSTIYVELPDKYWPDGVYHGGDTGDLVEVTGILEQRSDLPVFIQDPNEPPMHGMPMPPGTDLKEAAKRYVLVSVEWKSVQ